MTRFLCAVLAALALWVVLRDRVDAHPAAPPDCTLHPRFAAFREVATPGLVGDCREPATSDERGRLEQRTTRGRLYLDRGSNLVALRRSGTLLTEGPGGINSEVTVDGLSDVRVGRDPMQSRALSLLSYAMIRPGNLGAGWTYGTAPTPTYLDDVPPCDLNPLVVGYGTIATKLRHPETGRNVGQSVAAFDAPESWSMRDEMEFSLTNCFQSTVNVGDLTFQLTPSIQPLGPFGTESFMIRVDWHEPTRGVPLREPSRDVALRWAAQ